MNNSRLIEILRVFNKKEIRNLRKWVNSPIGNQREDVVLLFDYLLKNERYQENIGLSKTDIFEQVYNNLRYDDAKMRQLVFFGMKALEEYVIYQELRKDEIKARIALANFYRERNLDKAYQKNFKTLVKLQVEHPYRNCDFLKNEYLLQEEEYIASSRSKRSISLNLQEVSDSLHQTFIAEKLRQSYLMLAHQSVYQTDYKIGLIDEILKEVAENEELLNTPAIALYYYGYKTNTEKENPSHFVNLKANIFKHGYLFPRGELRDISLMAINYCIGQMNRGKDEFIRESFELYKEGFDKKLFLNNNLVSRWTFLNVVLNAIKLKEFSWAENFINENQIYLEDKYRESFINISFAIFYYQKRDFSKAMNYLLQYEHDDLTINLRAKNILLKIYYEEDEIVALESLLGSMRTYLSRKKIMGYHKDNFKNIIQLTKKLLKVKPYDQTQKDKLKALIEEANPLTTDDRNWLLTQLGKV